MFRYHPGIYLLKRTGVKWTFGRLWFRPQWFYSSCWRFSWFLPFARGKCQDGTLNKSRTNSVIPPDLSCGGYHPQILENNPKNYFFLRRKIIRNCWKIHLHPPNGCNTPKLKFLAETLGLFISKSFPLAIYLIVLVIVVINFVVRLYLGYKYPYQEIFRYDRSLISNN